MDHRSDRHVHAPANLQTWRLFYGPGRQSAPQNVCPRSDHEEAGYLAIARAIPRRRDDGSASATCRFPIRQLWPMQPAFAGVDLNLQIRRVLRLLVRHTDNTYHPRLCPPRVPPLDHGTDPSPRILVAAPACWWEIFLRRFYHDVQQRQEEAKLAIPCPPLRNRFSSKLAPNSIDNSTCSFSPLLYCRVFFFFHPEDATSCYPSSTPEAYRISSILRLDVVEEASAAAFSLGLTPTR